jgi:hypothetical protein
MGLLKLNRRPLTRETSDYRDDRLFIVACDDTYAPKQYFDSFQIDRVKLHVIPTLNGTSHAQHVLDRLLSYEHREGDERWILLDTDHCIKNGHISSFKAAIRSAQQNGVKIALSRSCFEVWLLLHHLEASDVSLVGNAKHVEMVLAATLGTYSKTRLHSEDFPLSKVVLACERALQLDLPYQGKLIPGATGSRVYKLWLAIAQGASYSQLPKELHSLRSL